MIQPGSVNFGFLQAHDPLLDLYAARAERYVFDDPNTSLMKLRQFAELLARHIAAFHGLETTDDDFRATLALIRKNRLATRDVVELFDHLRLKGNEAAHEGANDRRTALAGLITAHKLAGWFQQTFVDINHTLAPFRPPPNPEDAEASLKDELEGLRRKAAQYQKELEEAQGKIAELSQIQTTLEREAEETRLNLIFAEMQLFVAEKREEEVKEEKKRHEERLQNLQREAASKPPAVLDSFIDRSARAAERLGLSRDDSRYLPVAQIRLAGPNRSYCHNAKTLLVQSMKGGFVTANCSECGKSSTLRESDFFALDLWVSCAKCRSRMESAKIWSNYGFRCPRCNWSCELASLLPNWDELM